MSRNCLVIQRKILPSGTPAQSRQCLIDGNAIQPGGKRGLSAKSPDTPVSRDKGLLGGIVRLCTIAQHAQAQVENRLFPGQNQPVERHCIAGLRRPDPGIFHVPAIPSGWGGVAAVAVSRAGQRVAAGMLGR
jgi:hypothetical protein